MVNYINLDYIDTLNQKIVEPSILPTIPLDIAQPFVTG